MKKYLLIFLLFPCLAFGQHGIQAVFKQIQQNDVWHAFGGFEDSSVSVAITQDQWSVVTNATKNLWGGSEADGITLSGDTMTVVNPGDYFGVLCITFEGTNTNEYEFRVFSVTDNAQVGFKQGATGRGTGNYSRFTVPLYFECTANEKLVLQVTNTSGSNPAIMKFAQFVLVYLHD
jgi:hypothetical protein